MTDGPSREREFRAWAAARRAGLRRTAYLLCLDWHTADDVVQETLTKVYVRWPEVSASGGQDAYARRVIVTTVIDIRRRPWRREAFTDDLNLTALRAGVRTEDHVAARALEAVDDGYVRDRVTRALAALPRGMRAVIVLRFYEDLSVEQTAQELGCSTGNIKSQTSRGLQHLKKLLAPDLVLDDDSVDETSTITDLLSGGTR